MPYSPASRALCSSLEEVALPLHLRPFRTSCKKILWARAESRSSSSCGSFLTLVHFLPSPSAPQLSNSYSSIVASLGPLLPTFSSLIQQSVFTPLRISVFYTRAPTGKQPAFFASSSAGPFIGASPIAGPTYSNPLKHSATPPIPKRPPPLNLQDTLEGDLHRSRSGKGTAPLNVNMKRSGSGGSATTPGAKGDLKRAGSTPRSAAHPHEPPSSAAPLLPPAQASHFPPGLTLAPGKPRLLKFIENALQRAVTLGHGHSYSRVKDEELRLSGLVVGVCGPVGLADDVVAAVAGVDPVRRDQVGGVEVFEEVFGW